MSSRNLLVLGSLFLLLAGCSSSDPRHESGDGDADRDRVLFPASPEQLVGDSAAGLARADLKIGEIIAATPRTFENTVALLNDVLYEQDKIQGLQLLLMNASPDPAIREAAERTYLEGTTWQTRLFLNEQLFQAVEESTSSSPPAGGEEERLLENLRQEFRRKGIDQPPAVRQELAATFQRINELERAFEKNITDYDAQIVFSPGELEDLPESSLALFSRDADDNYLMDARIYSPYLAVQTFAVDEAVRLKAFKAYYSVAKDVNPAILAELVELRAQKARTLGYASHADLRTEDRMAKTAATARTFLENLSTGLENRFREEQQSLLDLKIRKTGESAASLNMWDLSFYGRILKLERHDFDPESLKKYFSLENCLTGMFATFEKCFGITILPLDPTPGERWHDDVRYYQVSDSGTDELLGSFYLDLFPRPGKYSHFAMSTIKSGNTSVDGTRERPVAYILGNWPKPTEETPSLLSFDEVRTLFHEFGHVMHALLSQPRYFKLFGNLVAWDFVEVPSQLLEQWLSQQEVLNRFAVNYEDRDDRLPSNYLEKMNAADQALLATFTRLQISHGMTDLILHTDFAGEYSIDAVAVGNEASALYYLPRPDDTASIARFGHLAGGYDAGYYSYLWALAIAHDLASAFKESDRGFLDDEIGMKLRREIYAPGASRDENESVRSFLGRDWTIGAYLKYLGGE